MEWRQVTTESEARWIAGNSQWVSGVISRTRAWSATPPSWDLEILFRKGFAASDPTLAKSGDEGWQERP